MQGGFVMHTKVIIASLICALAANSNVGKAFFRNIEKAGKTNMSGIVCDAPNAENGYFNITTDFANAGEEIEGEYIFEAGTIGEFRIISSQTSSALQARTITRDGSIFVRVTIPQVQGDYKVTFGRFNYYNASNGIMYIYSDGTKGVASSLSADDAREKFFFRYVASRSCKFELLNKQYDFNLDLGNLHNEMLPDLTGGLDFPIIDNPRFSNDYQPRGIPIDDLTGGIVIPPTIGHFDFLSSRNDAIKEFTDYVYGPTNDVETTTKIYAKDGSPRSMLLGTSLRVKAKWVDENGNQHPLIGVKVSFLKGDNNVILDDPYVGAPKYYTDNSGTANLKIPDSMVHSLTFGNISIQLSSINKAVAIEDGLGLNYPYLFRNKDNDLVIEGTTYHIPNSECISDYSLIQYDIVVYPERSDRASAYEICEAEYVPYNYAATFAEPVGAAKVYYPANTIGYDNGILKFDKRDYNNWDVLNHEYGHHICNELELCEIPQGRLPHKMHEDLSQIYGNELGLKLAYSEGLASYIGFAAQYYYRNIYGDIDLVGDYIYIDLIRNNTSCNFYDWHPSRVGYNYFRGEATEAAVLSSLAKLLDDVPQRSGDDVALGDQAMWDAILSASDIATSISNVFEELIDLHLEQESAIRNVAANEYIVVSNNADGYIFPNARDKWTIMIYACPSTNLTDSFLLEMNSIIAMAGKPDNVNIVVKVDGHIRGGGNTSLSNSTLTLLPGAGCEFTINNQRVVPDNEHSLTGDNMGDPNTLIDFVNRSIQKYPAKKMGLILYNHGRALNGVCHDARHHYTDELYGAEDDPLYNSEVKYALENIFNNNNLNGKFEFIGYDACLMQVQDVADYNSQYFKYMVASEEFTYHWGWSGFLNAIYQNKSTKTALKNLCDEFVPTNDSYFPTNKKIQGLSFLNLSRMDNYREEFETFAAHIKDTVFSNYDEFLDVISNTRHYGDDPDGAQNYKLYGTIDGYDFLSKLSESNSFKKYSSEIRSLMRSYNRVVTYNAVGVNAQDSHGLALHVCVPGTSQTYHSAETHFNNWRNLFL